MRITFLKTCEYKQETKEKSITYEEGKTYDVTDDHGNRWLRRNVAVLAAPDAKPETPTKPKDKPPPTSVKTSGPHGSIAAVRAAAGA